jgi:VanZ family protein
MRAKLNRQYAIVTFGMALMIAYGSLYPFQFSSPSTGPGPVHALLATWANKPGRGDFLSNILLYTPLGFFGALTLTNTRRIVTRFLTILLLGATLSISVELAQYYDVGRDTQAVDLYANVLGTAVGALAGVIFGAPHNWGLLSEITDHRIPALLVLAWAAYRLYPFVPTIDLHKYWNTLKPLLFMPNTTGYDLFRHTAIWLTIFTLLSKLAAYRRMLIIPIFACTVLFSKILIISTSLSVAEVGGALGAYCIWIVLYPRGRVYVVVVLVLFGATVIAQRLEPFQFTTYPVPFGWIPFRSFMYGSIDVDVLSFLEKFFLYGSFIWLLVEAGVSHRSATVSVGGTLLATSIAETYLPHRSAEITDAMMALAIGGIFALISGERRREDVSKPTAISSPRLRRENR